MEKREALLGTVKHRTARYLPSSTQPDASGTQRFVFISEDNGGTRYDWGTGEFYEELLIADGADYSGLNTFFKDHDRSVDSAIGRIENVNVVGGTVEGDVIFGTGAEEQSVARKYEEGILTDVSVGYVINNYTVEKREDQMDLVKVTDYTLFEVSAVGIGFDSGAKAIRDAGEEPVDEELLKRVEALEKKFNLKQGDTQ